MIARALAATAAVLALGGCATIPTRLYSQDEITEVSRACGFAAGEMFQEAEEPRLLFVFTPKPSSKQLKCVKKWSRKRSLTLALIDVEWMNN